MSASSPSRFETLRRLGSGGMADVFLAREGSTGTLVALKRIRANQPELLKQFDREARICTLLQHHNIVRLERHGQDEAGPYLALEYVDGCSLGALVKHYRGKGERVPMAAVLSIAADVAAGLSYAHRLVQGDIAGVLHRDLSPDNILISTAGMAKLSDFGIAKALGLTDFTRTGVVKGKLGYLAPELFEGADASEQTDLFGLGATLFLLVTGVPAFSGKNEAELMRSVIAAKPPHVSTLCADVPPQLAMWIDLSLSQDPRRRPQLELLLETLGAHEGERPFVAAAVREVLAVAPAAEAPAAQPDTATFAKELKPASRRAPVLAALAVLVLGGVGGTAWLMRPREPFVAPPIVLPAPPTAPEPVVEAPAEAPAAPEPRASPRTGLLRIKVRPWAQVFVDGKPRGMTPLAPLALAPGTHSVILVNDKLNARREHKVTVKAGGETELKVLLDK